MKSYHRGTIIGTLVGGLFGLVIAAGAVALAAPDGPGKKWDPERMEQHMREIFQQLDLSAAQEAQIETIMADTKAQITEIKDMPRSQEKFEAMRDLRFTTEDQIHANLSCEQREQLRLLTQEHRAERMQKRFERHFAEETEQTE